MGAVVSLSAYRTTGKEYVIPMDRTSVAPKEVPVIIGGHAYLRSEIIDIVRGAFEPYSQEAKAKTAEAFLSVARLGTPFSSSNVRITERDDRDNLVRSFCPLGYCAHEDGRDDVSSECLWATAQNPWRSMGVQDGSDRWHRARTTTQDFIHGWDDGYITADMLDEALRS